MGTLGTWNGNDGNSREAEMGKLKTKIENIQESSGTGIGTMGTREKMWWEWWDHKRICGGNDGIKREDVVGKGWGNLLICYIGDIKL